MHVIASTNSRSCLSPAEGFVSAYSFDAWKADNRIQFKAVESAHGINGEVTFNFTTRRRYSDTGVEGAQLDEAYIFEGIGRALLRQHILIEDLSQSECLPRRSA